MLYGSEAVMAPVFLRFRKPHERRLLAENYGRFAARFRTGFWDMRVGQTRTLYRIVLLIFSLAIGLNNGIVDKLTAISKSVRLSFSLTSVAHTLTHKPILFTHVDRYFFYLLSSVQ